MLKYMPGSFSMEGDGRGRRGIVIIQGDWDEQNLLPARGTAWPSIPTLRVKSYKIDGWGTPRPGGTYDQFRATLVYSEDYISVGDLPVYSSRPVNRALQYGLGRTYTSDGVINWDQPASIPITMWDQAYRIKYYQATWESFEPTIAGLSGKVNSSVWRGKAAGTVIYNGPEVDTEWDENYNLIYVVNHSFVYSPNWPHNNVWRPDKGIYDTYTTPLYTLGNFGVLGF